jgi:CubicO group peptidase (beta-lactamase class C family)
LEACLLNFNYVYIALFFLALLIGCRTAPMNNDVNISQKNDSTFRDVKYSYRPPMALSDEWQVGDLLREKAELGEISRGIEKILRITYSEMNSIIVVRHGKILLEEYFNGKYSESRQPLWSVTKSVFATVYGIAQDQGRINVNEKVYDFFPQARKEAGWDPAKNAMTVGMLLNMTSGFDCIDMVIFFKPACWQDMVQSTDWIDYCLSKPLAHPPGQIWNYNGASLVLLSNRIAQKSGMSFPDFAQKYLFDELGIQGTTWKIGPNGVTKVDEGISWTPRDMAKLGQLYLNKGKWRGKQVVSEKWVEAATTVKAPKGQAFGHDYGYLWHLKSMKWKGKDTPVYYANGYHGQNVFVVPEAGLVCVLTADSNDPRISLYEENLLEESILTAFK